MNEAQRFLRYVTPGLVCLLQTALFLYILFPEWMVYQVREFSDAGIALVALLAAGGLGFVLSVAHHTYHWAYDRRPDHRDLIRRLHSTALLELRDATTRAPLASVDNISRMSAWITLTALWHERQESAALRGVERKAVVLAALMHSSGSARIASIVSWVAALFIAAEIANWSLTLGTILRFVLMNTLAGALVIMHRRNYDRVSTMAEGLIEQTLCDALDAERKAGRPRTHVLENFPGGGSEVKARECPSVNLKGEQGMRNKIISAFGRWRHTWREWPFFVLSLGSIAFAIWWGLRQMGEANPQYVPVAAGVALAGVFFGEAGRLGERRISASESVMKAASDSLDRTIDLLNDGNNHRATWISAARLVESAKMLQANISEPGHKQHFDALWLEAQARLRTFLGFGKNLNPSFFYGVSQNVEDLDRAEELSRSREATSSGLRIERLALDEASLYSIWSFCKFPEDYDDPVSGQFRKDDELKVQSNYPALHDYLRHRGVWSN